MPVEKVIMVAQEEFLRKQVAQFLRKSGSTSPNARAFRRLTIILAKAILI